MSSPLLAVNQRLTSPTGEVWRVIGVHPPQGRRMQASYTLVREHDDWAVLFDSAEINDLGLELLQAE